jgi:probable blue pigment (indigoidine) exporter
MNDHTKGSVALTIAAFLWAPTFSLTKNKLFGVLIGFVGISVIALSGEDLTEIANYTTQNWIIIAYLIISGSVIAYTLWIYGISKMEVSRSSFYLFLVPVFALLIGWISLGESLSGTDLLGIILIFISILSIELNTKRN